MGQTILQEFTKIKLMVFSKMFARYFRNDSQKIAQGILKLIPNGISQTMLDNFLKKLLRDSSKLGIAKEILKKNSEEFFKETLEKTLQIFVREIFKQIVDEILKLSLKASSYCKKKT